MRRTLIIVITLLTAISLQCSNYDLSARLESPGGNAGKGTSSISVVNTNITASLSTGGVFAATVTFSRAVNIPVGSITIDNGATVNNLSTSDNVTWTFDLNGLNSGTYTVMFSAAISDSSGATLIPFSVTFTHTLN